MQKVDWAREKIQLRKFLAEAVGVEAPRWVWWLVAALLLIPLRATVGL
jgi:hypothetical protein